MDLLDFGGVFPVLLLLSGMGVRSRPSTAATMRSLRAGEDMPGMPRGRLGDSGKFESCSTDILFVFLFFPNVLHAIAASCIRGACMYMCVCLK